MIDRLEHDPKREESLRMQIDSLIQNYLNQKPIPGITDFAEVFGAADYVTQLKKQKAVKVDIKAFREEMVTKLLEQSEASGIEVILPKVFEMLPQTILPPDEGEMIQPGSGEGIEKKKYIPRTQYLIELFSEMGESYEIIGGKNTVDMMRERTYFIFFLPNSQKALFVNNEEGNTTFIIYQVNSKQEAIDMAALTKDEIRAKELHDHPYVQLDWTGDGESWKGKVLECLTMSVPKDEKREKKVKKNLDNNVSLDSENKEVFAEWNEERALKSLEQAHIQWKVLNKSEGPKKKKVKFNLSWMQKNGFGGVVSWGQRNKILNDLIAKTSEEFKKDFSKKIENRPVNSLDDALKFLNQAFDEWKQEDDKTRRKFNPNWLNLNGFSSVVSWSKDNGGIEKFLSQTSDELRNSFEKRDRVAAKYDKALVLKRIEEGHKKWQNQDEKVRGDFNKAWLEANGFAPVVQWVRKNGEFQNFLKDSSEDIQRDFVEQEQQFEPYTVESAIEKLEQAHKKWEKEGKSQKKKFNKQWIEFNGFRGLSIWVREQFGHLNDFVTLASDKLRKDFTYEPKAKKDG